MRVDSETKERIRLEAEKLGISIAEYIRRAATGEVPLLKEIKEQLDRIERKLDKK